MLRSEGPRSTAPWATTSQQRPTAYEELLLFTGPESKMVSAVP